MAATDHKTTPLVSVVVTTRNSGAFLRACLESARRQDYPHREVVVVDNGSTDATMAIAHELADIVLTGGPERSAQRNAGIRAAHGDWVAIVDADMVLDPDVVSSCVAAATASGARAVHIPEVSFGAGFWSRCRAFERSFYLHDPIVTAARFFDRARLLELGGYDESLTGGEDWDMSMRASEDGQVVFSKGVIRHDEGRPTLPVLFAKRYYYARSWPAFVRKHGSAALARLTPARRALWRNVGRMVLHPVLGSGVIVMKSVESAGALLGMMNARSADRATRDAASAKR